MKKMARFDVLWPWASRMNFVIYGLSIAVLAMFAFIAMKANSQKSVAVNEIQLPAIAEKAAVVETNQVSATEAQLNSFGLTLSNVARVSVK